MTLNHISPPGQKIFSTIYIFLVKDQSTKKPEDQKIKVAKDQSTKKSND